MRLLLATVSAFFARDLQIQPLEGDITWRADGGRAVAPFAGEWDLAAELDATTLFTSDSLGSTLRSNHCHFESATVLHSHNCSTFTSDAVCHERLDKRTWLASYPGSGNTWTRAVLQGATQILTGAAYYDRSLFDYGFKAEGNVDQRDVLAVKTHHPFFTQFAKKHPHSQNDRALVVTRHPLTATLSYLQFSLTGGSHAGEAASETLRKAFDRSRSGLLRGWKDFARVWLNHQGEKTLLKFEDIVAAPETTYSKKIMPFLGLRGDSYAGQLPCALSAASQNKFLHRNHTHKFTFNEEDAAAAESIAGLEMARLGYGRQLHC